MRRVGALLSGLSIFAALFAGIPVEAEQPVAITSSAGGFAVFDGVERYETGWEVSFAPRQFRWVPRFLHKTNPTLGFMATSQGTLYLYGGFRYDLPLGESWWLSPQWATGLYYRDGGRELGGTLEFRSGIELSRRLGGRSRLGVMLYHLSNARIYGYNPGGESLVLTYTAHP
jgi:hypothetical protein